MLLRPVPEESARDGRIVRRWDVPGERFKPGDATPLLLLFVVASPVLLTAGGTAIVMTPFAPPAILLGATMVLCAYLAIVSLYRSAALVIVSEEGILIPFAKPPFLPWPSVVGISFRFRARTHLLHFDLTIEEEARRHRSWLFGNDLDLVIKTRLTRRNDALVRAVEEKWCASRRA